MLQLMKDEMDTKLQNKGKKWVLTYQRFDYFYYIHIKSQNLISILILIFY